MLVLPNVTMGLSNVRKKNKGTTKCDKSTVTFNVGIAQFEDDAIKCEGKKKSTTKCGKSIVKCDASTTQCYNGSSNVKKK